MNSELHSELMADYDRYDGFPRGDEMQDWMDSIEFHGPIYQEPVADCDDCEDVPF